MNIIASRHPLYLRNYSNWAKWWKAYVAGDNFLENLRQYSKRESQFQLRKDLTPIPAFAKTAINEVINALLVRMPSVTREVNSTTFMSAIQGNNGGVDGLGSSLSLFFAKETIARLLVQGVAGILVDMPKYVGKTKADSAGYKPYLCAYTAENILNHDYLPGTKQLSVLSLRNTTYTTDKETGLPNTLENQYLYYRKVEGGVEFRRFTHNGTEVKDDHTVLEIDEIPFVMLEINQSLMADIYRHQIALLNIGSTDVMFALLANFPIYTEQMDNTMQMYRQQIEALRQQALAQADGKIKDEDIEKLDNIMDRIGNVTGRTYAVGAERPGFINPSTDPLKVSMEKQEMLKKEIRQLVSLSLASLRATSTGADSQTTEDRNLESGLVSLGLVLEAAEREIATFWCAYENIAVKANISYPRDYTLKTQQEWLKDSGSELDLVNRLPSLTLKRETAKQVVNSVFGTKFDQATLDRINKEIDDAKIVIVDPKEIQAMVEAGVLSRRTITGAMGLPDDEVEVAAQEHEERLKRIAEAQSDAAISSGSGNKDATTPESRKEEKSRTQSADNNADAQKSVRGEGK